MVWKKCIQISDRPIPQLVCKQLALVLQHFLITICKTAFHLYIIDHLDTHICSGVLHTFSLKYGKINNEALSSSNQREYRSYLQFLRQLSTWSLWDLTFGGKSPWIPKIKNIKVIRMACSLGILICWVGQAKLLILLFKTLFR